MGRSAGRQTALTDGNELHAVAGNRTQVLWQSGRALYTLSRLSSFTVFFKKSFSRQQQSRKDEAKSVFTAMKQMNEKAVEIGSSSKEKKSGSQ